MVSIMLVESRRDHRFPRVMNPNVIIAFAVTVDLYYRCEVQAKRKQQVTEKNEPIPTAQT